MRKVGCDGGIVRELSGSLQCERKISMRLEEKYLLTKYRKEKLAASFRSTRRSADLDGLVPILELSKESQGTDGLKAYGVERQGV